MVRGHGEIPYKTVVTHREAEAQRAALDAITYGEKEHTANPFCGDNMAQQAALTKRDPQLAAFYRAESVPVDLPLFGKSRNLTCPSVNRQRATFFTSQDRPELLTTYP
jgi:hypothetical protein